MKITPNDYVYGDSMEAIKLFHLQQFSPLSKKRHKVRLYTELFLTEATMQHTIRQNRSFHYWLVQMFAIINRLIENEKKPPRMDGWLDRKTME